jgi:ATP-dependent helicase HrpB
LQSHRNLVIVAEPGAGKTTRLPPLLFEFLNDGRKILMLEPRRLAARAAAARIADEQGWAVGGVIGYQVRFENRIGRDTRIEVITEGLLSRRLQSDPELRAVSTVIIDEFHERSLQTDLGLSMLYELQQLARPDLRIVVMSATLDAVRVASFLGDAPIIDVPGRTHPVSVSHTIKPQLLETGPEFTSQVTTFIGDVMSGARPRLGDILVFLPGAGEIRRVREQLEPILQRANAVCFELHGGLSLEEQNRALAKSSQIKLVLATNIAETSLTIDGVGTVIDTGLSRGIRTDAFGFQRLQLGRISLASAKQRAGRAGRQAPGLCYRLWNKMDEASMNEFEAPEILRTDLAETVLLLAAQGVSDAAAFSWYEAPKTTALLQSKNLLLELGMLNQDGAITELGRAAVRLPVSPRLGKLLLEGARLGLAGTAAKLAALLSEKDIVRDLRELKRASQIESDLLMRLSALEDESHAVDRISVRQVKRVAQDLIKISGTLGASDRILSGSERSASVEEILLRAFPDRVCRRRRPQERAALMVGGRGVLLSAFSCVETSPLFLALELGGDRGDLTVQLATEISRATIAKCFKLVSGHRIIFDTATLSVQKLTSVFYQDLPLDEPKISRPTQEEAYPVLLEALEERWSSHVVSSTNVKMHRLLERLYFLKASGADQEFNDWLEREGRQAVLQEITYGETRLSEVLAKPIDEIILRLMPAHLAASLQRDAPETITVPSGSKLPIEYPREQAPYLEVRIQEIFGWVETPRLAGGKIPLTLHLLGPNFRPVQLTADLGSFWRTGYNEVRRELKIRYPKHSWPEDPFSAQPEAKGRRRT